MEIADNLNTRFNIVVQSTSELEFYQNLYHYFDFIHKTPQLLAIFEASEEEYTKNHSNLWKKFTTDEEIDEAAAQTTKLERFNLFAVGSAIYVRIYWPIDDYRKTNESDKNQDVVAVILMRGSEYAISLKKWSKDTIKTYTRWFDGKRDYYEKHFRLFHTMFLDELSKPKSDIKLKIEFNGEQSILTIGDKKVSIKLRTDRPVDHYVLEYIFENGISSQAYYDDILQDKFRDDNRNERTLRRACESINSKVSKQANLNNFLNFKTGESGFVEINPDYL